MFSKLLFIAATIVAVATGSPETKDIVKLSVEGTLGDSTPKMLHVGEEYNVKIGLELAYVPSDEFTIDVVLTNVDTKKTLETFTLGLSNFTSSGTINSTVDDANVIVDYENVGSFDVSFDPSKWEEVDMLESGYHSIQVVATLETTGESGIDSTEFDADTTIIIIPGIVSLIPLIVTIFIALIARNTYAALMVGIYLVAFIETQYSVEDAMWKTWYGYAASPFADPYKVQVIFFSIFLSGVVALMAKSGGTQGMANSFVHMVDTLPQFIPRARIGQLVSYFAGWMIFFDDYSNALVVGNAMRPVLDKLKVSREKLAFIVDATSAPIASLVPISAWIAFELGVIQAQLENIGAENLASIGVHSEPLLVFLETLASRYYPWVMLCFQLYLIFTGLEFGPMLRFERRRRLHEIGDGLDDDFDDEEAESVKAQKVIDTFKEDGTEPPPNQPLRWWNAVIPILVIIISVTWTLVNYGLEYCDPDSELGCGIAGVFGSTDPYVSLIEGAVISFLFCIVFYLVQRKSDGEIVFFPRGKALLGFNDSVETFVRGITNLTPAVIILILAWGIGETMGVIGAGRYFTNSLDGQIAPAALPGLVFILSALVALATGTSWGTMEIMFGLVSGIAYNTGDSAIFYGIFGSILSGAVFGDHCSPISDTTVLSSIATRCDLATHVITQAPYAIFVATITTILGDFIGAASGMPHVVALLLCIAVTFPLLLLVGAPVISSNGRLDVFGRIGVKIGTLTGTAKEDQETYILQQKSMLAYEQEPVRVFDPFARLVGGGLDSSEALVTVAEKADEA